MARMWILLCLGFAVLLLSGCAVESEPTAPKSSRSGNQDEVLFADQIAGSIFGTTCSIAGCHDASTVSAGLKLTPADAFAELVNIQSTEEPSLKRVEPGDPENSYLWWKIRPGGPGNGTQRMPASGSLSDDQIELIRLWIEQGAKDN